MDLPSAGAAGSSSGAAAPLEQLFDMVPIRIHTGCSIMSLTRSRRCRPEAPRSGPAICSIGRVGRHDHRCCCDSLIALIPRIGSVDGRAGRRDGVTTPRFGPASYVYPCVRRSPDRGLFRHWGDGTSPRRAGRHVIPESVARAVSAALRVPAVGIGTDRSISARAGPLVDAAAERSPTWSGATGR